MNIWTDAELQEITISETQYGGITITDFDNIYQNAEGKWEGTFVPNAS